MITRTEYMNDSKNLHHKFYSQFYTENTKKYILRVFTIDELKKAFNQDEHLNNLKLPYNHMGRGGGWWWDDAPINRELLKKCGGSYSPSSITSTAKACAKDLISNQ